MPNKIKAILHDYVGKAEFLFWDIDNNIQFGEDIVIEDSDTEDPACFSISPDGSK